MAKDKPKVAGEEESLEYVYVGTHENTAMEPIEERPSPPNIELARNIALAALSGARGRYRTSDHFHEQMASRDFDVFDFEYAIRNGKPTKQGVYSEKHKDFEYTFRCNIDGTDFDAAFSISARHHFTECPLVILITGVWKTKSGKLKESF